MECTANMRVIYDEIAKFQILDAVEYGRQEFDPLTAMRFRKRLRSLIQNLKRTPWIGKVEKALSDECSTYRSVNMEPFKIIYSVKGNSLRIHLLWNTRKDPNDLHL